MNALSNELDNYEQKNQIDLSIEGTEKGPNNNQFRGHLTKFKCLYQGAATRT